MAIRRAGPIHPRIKDMRLYEAEIRKTYLNPMFDRLGRRLAQAESANQAWAAMDDVVGKMAAQPRFGIPTDQSGQGFRRKLDGNSGPNWTVIPK